MHVELLHFTIETPPFQPSGFVTGVENSDSISSQNGLFENNDEDSIPAALRITLSELDRFAVRKALVLTLSLGLVS